MESRMSWKSWVVLGVAVAVLVTSGTFVMASNMGFKINKQFYGPYTTADAPKKDNYISLPYNNPYPNPKALCVALGLSGFTQTIGRLNPATGTYADGNGDIGFLFRCNQTGPNCNPGQSCNPMPTNVGLQVRAGLVGNFAKVLVGSSNEAEALPTIYGNYKTGTSPKFINWISVPYHTTWVTASDVCQTLGMTSFGSGSIVRYNPDPNATTISTWNCSFATGGFNLVIGEALMVRKNTVGDLSGIMPPHF